MAGDRSIKYDAHRAGRQPTDSPAHWCRAYDLRIRSAVVLPTLRTAATGLRRAKHWPAQCAT